MLMSLWVVHKKILVLPLVGSTLSRYNKIPMEARGLGRVLTFISIQCGAYNSTSDEAISLLSLIVLSIYR